MLSLVSTGAFLSMMSRLARFRLVWLPAICAAFSGCVGGVARRDDALVPAPAMPTMGPQPAAPQPRPADSEVVATALRFIRNNDLSPALQAIASVKERGQRDRVALEVTQTLAGQNPPAAAAFAIALPPGLSQTNAIEAAALAWTRRDPGAAFRWSLDLNDPPTAAVARRAVLTELVRSNPRATIERVTALPPSTAREDTLIAAVAAWARVDPDGAIGWLRDLPDSALKPRLTSSVAFEVALRNPPRAVSLAETLPAGRNRWLLFTAIAQTWVATDAKAAIEWMSGLPAGEPRDAASAGIDTGLGVPASRRLAGGPAAVAGGGARIRGGGAVVASAWSGITSPEFEEWLKLQPPGLSRDEAILEYIRQRGASDLGGIGQWITMLPGGLTRTRAMELYLDNLIVASPGDAANWLRSLPRSDRSDEMIEKTARRWLLTNPDAAEAWLRETPLLPDRKEQLLREAGR
jgi:hypothetical protein